MYTHIQNLHTYTARRTYTYLHNPLITYLHNTYAQSTEKVYDPLTPYVLMQPTKDIHTNLTYAHLDNPTYTSHPNHCTSIEK